MSYIVAKNDVRLMILLAVMNKEAPNKQNHAHNLAILHGHYWHGVYYHHGEAKPHSQKVITSIALPPPPRRVPEKNGGCGGGYSPPQLPTEEGA